METVTTSNHGLLTDAAMAGALLISGMMLGSAFYIEADIARAFCLGAFCFTLAFWILLFTISRNAGTLHHSRERFQLALAISNDGLWDWDLTTDRIFFSRGWYESLGYDPGQVPTTADFWKQLIHPDHREHVLAELQAHLDGHSDTLQCEIRLLTGSGNYRWILSRARVVDRDKHGRATRIIGVDVDMTALHQLSTRLSHQESHDGLTGLVNRREFERRLQNLLGRSRGQAVEHTLCHIDVDRFKVINETCGPAAGDELLRELARLLRKRLRHRDTLARIGGDEFGVLMEDCSVVHAEHVARTLLETLEDLRFNWRGRSYAVNASIGLVAITDGREAIADVLCAADAACHTAKERGGHRIHVFSIDDSELARRQGHMQWVSRISRALDDDRFRLSFQPIAPVSAGDSTAAHYELLVRLQEENGDLVAPEAFLPAAEQYSLCTRLDRWVVAAAFDWLDRHPRHVEELGLCAINLSGHSLSDDEFLKFVVNQFGSSRVPPEKVCFEITETAAISNVEHASHFMRTLKELGSRFALDDFGSGLSSFAYLQTLPVDFLKIDGMFVKDIAEDPIHLAMVRSINEVGHIMGMKTVAEFVEDNAILALLREIGVDYAQGYGICPPRPLEVFERTESPWTGACGLPRASVA